MSAAALLTLREQEELDRRRRSRVAASSRVAPRPVVRRRAVPKLLGARAIEILLVVGLSTALGYGVYAFSSLTGSGRADSARREAVRSIAQTKEVEESLESLEKHVDRLMAVQTIKTWAHSRGLIDPTEVALASPVEVTSDGPGGH